MWQDKMNPFREDSVRRDPNFVEGVDVPATMEVLRLPDTFSPIDDVMVRADYGEALRDIEGHCTRKRRKSIIVIGHPGIGKTRSCALMGKHEYSFILRLI